MQSYAILNMIYANIKLYRMLFYEIQLVRHVNTFLDVDMRSFAINWQILSPRV